MNEQIEKLRASIIKDEARILELQQSVKLKKERLKEKEAAALQNSLNIIAARGNIRVADIVSAIEENDITLLLALTQAEQEGHAPLLPTDSENERTGLNNADCV